MLNPLKKKSLSQIIWITGLSLITAVNTYQLILEQQKLNRLKPLLASQFTGEKFSGLENILKSQKYVGYYTDKNLKDIQNDKQFAQAQLVLAPSILDINNTNHEYTLLDCTSLKTALQIMKEANITPVKKNRFGIILAKKNL